MALAAKIFAELREHRVLIERPRCTGKTFAARKSETVKGGKNQNVTAFLDEAM